MLPLLGDRELPAALRFPVGFTIGGTRYNPRQRPTRHAVTDEVIGVGRGDIYNGVRPHKPLCGRGPVWEAEGRGEFDGRHSRDCARCRRRLEALVAAVGLPAPIVAATLHHQTSRSPVRHACDAQGIDDDGRPVADFARAPCGQLVQPWWPATLTPAAHLPFDPADPRSCPKCVAGLRRAGRI